MAQFSGGSVTIRGGILYFSRARAREGFGDISGILAVFGGGRAAADDFAIFEMNFFRKFSSNFWFFVAIVGKISSSSCQSRKKNSKIH